MWFLKQGEVEFGNRVCLELKSGSHYREALRPYDLIAKREN